MKRTVRSSRRLTKLGVAAMALAAWLSTSQGLNGQSLERIAEAPRWQNVPLFGGPVSALAAAASGPRIVYASTPHGLYRSENDGRTWRLTNRLFALSLAVAFDDPQTLFGEAILRRGEFVRSRDGGSTWSVLKVPDFEDIAASRIFLDPARSGVVWAATGNGLYRSDDLGETWAPFAFDGVQIHAFAADPRDPRRLFVGGEFESADDSIAWSTDSGETWTVASLPSPTFTSEFIFPRTTGPIYLHASEIYRSDDLGVTWRRLPDPAPSNGFLVAEKLAVSPSGALFAATHDGLFRSTDRGESWQPDSQGPASPDEFVSSVVALAGPQPAVLAASAGGLWRSENDGLRFRDSSRGIFDSVVLDVAAASDETENVFALSNEVRASSKGGPWLRGLRSRLGVGGRFVRLHLDPTDGGHVFAHGVGGLFESRDGGATWSGLAKTYRGLLSVLLTFRSTLAIDPNEPKNLYLSIEYAERFTGGEIVHQFWASRDGGRSWRKNRVADFAHDLKVDPERRGVLYAATDRGLLQSDDFGSRWRRVGGPRAALSLANDAQAPRTLWLGTRAGEVLRSTDGGTTFAQLGAPFENAVKTLVVDPHRPEEILVGVAREGVFRWNPRSRHSRRWRLLGDGFPTSAFRGVFSLDARNRRLWAATEGAGLQQLELGGE